MKVVITGGTGFIGLRLAQRLLEIGELTGPSGRKEAIDTLLLFDQFEPTNLPAALKERVQVQIGEVAAGGLLLGIVFVRGRFHPKEGKALTLCPHLG